MSVINTNMMSLNTRRHLDRTEGALSTTMERLSSGLRVNSAKDDAAGLAIATRLSSQINGMNVAMRNANDGISMAQTAEGAMSNLGDMLSRMRDLAVQSMNGSNAAGDRLNLDTEYKQLASELQRVINSTTFNGNAILNGKAYNNTTSKVIFQVGADATANNQITISMSNMSNGAMKSVFAANNISTTSKASKAVVNIDLAITQVTTLRAKLGAVQNRLSNTITGLRIAVENQSAARSRIMDADFAAETSSLSRNQILQQAGTAMLSQANSAPQQVLSLLQ